MYLILVESPTKSKTLQKFLGKDYRMAATMGHIRDLPEKELGIDIEHDFKPKYLVIPKAKKTVQTLKKEAAKASLVILAMDEDREGEAIAYHLIYLLKLNGQKKYQRIVFHEITKSAIKQALKNPRKIDLRLVDAQQARRILDRLVGYKLSPFLWTKVAKGLSAGRVQSVAVRLIVDREKEIQAFQPEEYWTIEALLRKITNSKLQTTNKSQITNNKLQIEFLAKLVKQNGQTILRLGIKTKEQAKKIVKDLEGAEYRVIDIQQKETQKHPAPPFTTSTLQQTAWQRFKFPAKFTMSLAQSLYEKGLITYHRTDSLNLADQALSQVKKFIIEQYGGSYWPGKFIKYKTKAKRAQEAHEAIRPTQVDRQPTKIKQALDSRQVKLYDLIWRRFVACQMSPAILDSTIVDILAHSVIPSDSEESRRKQSATGSFADAQDDNKGYIFRATGSIIKFDGFLKVYSTKLQETLLPPLSKDEILELIKLIPDQHFTQPPARYTEATLVKALEEHGIGRPSTYAPIMSTIQGRSYVEKNEQKKFQPTEIGFLVNDLLVENFPRIVDIQFTARMEGDLDKIAAGQENWVPVIKKFYQPFQANLLKKYQEVEKKKTIAEKTEKKCPECGQALVIRLGRFGKFYACSGFPKCRYTQPMLKSTGLQCPACGQGEIVERKSKKGKVFYGCSKYPDCNFVLWGKPLPGRQAGTGEKCPKCGSLLIAISKNKIKCSNRECDYKKDGTSTNS